MFKGVNESILIEHIDVLKDSDLAMYILLRKMP